MTFPELRRLGVIVLPVLLGGGCAGDDPALLQTCAAADGRGNLYEATNIQMLDALESATPALPAAAGTLSDHRACHVVPTKGALPRKTG